MRTTRITLLALVAFVASACAGGSLSVPNADRADVRERLRQQWSSYFDKEDRVWNVSWPIITSNASLCPSIDRFSGISWLTPDGFKSTKNDRVYRYPPSGDLSAVQTVAPGSPADSVGLLPGDLYRILNMPKSSLNDRVRGRAPEKPRAWEMEVHRPSGVDTLTVPTVWACDTWVHVARDGSVNAFTDGSEIAVTEGLVDFVESDEELAFVVSHELAHIGLNHVGKRKRNSGLLGALGVLVDAAVGCWYCNTGGKLAGGGAAAYSAEFEAEADYMGAYMTARAGYDPAVAKTFFSRMSESSTTPRVWGTTHPVNAQRELNATIFADEVALKQAAGEQLRPEKKE